MRDVSSATTGCPEVAAGEDATPQADVYALGVMLIRWLTGFYYGDNPGAIALLSRKKYRWLGVISRMLSLEQRATMKGQSEDLRGFQTQQEDSPWIMLELDKRRQITGLVIESWGWSTRPLRVWVSDDGKNVKGAPIASDDIGHRCYRFDLQHQNITTKYLVIGRKQGAVKDWFFLDKVLIYGKDK